MTSPTPDTYPRGKRVTRRDSIPPEERCPSCDGYGRGPRCPMRPPEASSTGPGSDTEELADRWPPPEQAAGEAARADACERCEHDQRDAHELLDGVDIPDTDDHGETLTVSQRVRRLINVTKDLSREAQRQVDAAEARYVAEAERAAPGASPRKPCPNCNSILGECGADFANCCEHPNGVSPNGCDGCGAAERGPGDMAGEAAQPAGETLRHRCHTCGAGVFVETCNRCGERRLSESVSAALDEQDRASPPPVPAPIAVDAYCPLCDRIDEARGPACPSCNCGGRPMDIRAVVVPSPPSGAPTAETVARLSYLATRKLAVDPATGGLTTVAKDAPLRDICPVTRETCSDARCSAVLCHEMTIAPSPPPVPAVAPTSASAEGAEVTAASIEAVESWQSHRPALHEQQSDALAAIDALGIRIGPPVVAGIRAAVEQMARDLAEAIYREKGWRENSVSRAMYDAAVAERDALHARVEQADHFTLRPSPVAKMPGPTDEVDPEPYDIEIDRIEIGRSGDDRLFRVVAFVGDGPFAEMTAPLLGKDGAWHERPNKEIAAFGELTGFPTADAAFDALGHTKGAR